MRTNTMSWIDRVKQFENKQQRIKLTSKRKKNRTIGKYKQLICTKTNYKVNLSIGVIITEYSNCYVLKDNRLKSIAHYPKKYGKIINKIGVINER